ncbi:hypothetical protein HPB50_015872 [Hyalomma asiaticum]|uniref:Uncharacterized protein n=1 Tax=Hyalomma asiaticum TaxID=266040 RepID=A0ACB7RTH3_HYAAI|nr:hypothetical protein HPB50_015872 [Hyalomma asiaticum]
MQAGRRRFVPSSKSSTERVGGWDVTSSPQAPTTPQRGARTEPGPLPARPRGVLLVEGAPIDRQCIAARFSVCNPLRAHSSGSRADRPNGQSKQPAGVSELPFSEQQRSIAAAAAGKQPLSYKILLRVPPSW